MTQASPDGGIQYLPSISVVIPAYNAETRIKSKIENTLRCDYPKDLFEAVVVSDGSTDATVKVARSLGNKNIAVIDLKKNVGKSGAQNAGVGHAKGEIVIFTDVDSDLDGQFIRKIVPLFSDPLVGCVGGTAVHRHQKTAISRSQGTYWSYEQSIRRHESDLGIVTSLPGWGFAIRKSDFVPLDQDTGDDLVLPLEMALRGKRSMIAPDAFVTDTMPATPSGELKARIRITLRNFTALMRRKALLNPFLYPGIAFALWSHKVLRWFSPFLLLSIVISTSFLAVVRGGCYMYACGLQIAFMMAGFLGYLLFRSGYSVPVLGHVSSFFIANTGFMIGILKYFRGQRIWHYRNE